MKIRKQFIFILFIISLFSFVSCSNANVSENESDLDNNVNESNNSGEEQLAEDLVDREPVTLRMAADHYTDELFDDIFKEPVEDMYPHITLEKVGLPWSVESIEEHILSDELPDIILRPTADMQTVRETGIFTDLEPFIEKYDFDLDLLKPELVDTILSVGKAIGDVTIPMFPVNLDHSAMIYNKDIFDLLGVEYPEDGMTWDEVIDLAKELTREVGGIQYKGLATMPATFFGTQLALDYVDFETNEPLVNSEDWRKAFETLREIHTLPGNEDAYGWLGIIGDQTIAMYPRVNVYEQVMDLDEDELTVNWDIVQYPYFPEKPDVGYGAFSHNVVLSSMSEHPDDAFLAMTAMLSDKAQMVAAEYMKVPAVADEKLEENFGKRFPIFEDKNIDAILKSKAEPSTVYTMYDAEAAVIMDTIFEEMIMEEGADINSALRKAEEEVEILIEEIKSQQ